MTHLNQTHLVSLNIRYLSALECYQLGRRLLAHLEELSESFEIDPQLPKSELALRKVLKTFKDILDGTERQYKHHNLQGVDQQRKEEFRALANALSAFKKSRRDREKEAYKLLSLLLKDHKEATQVSYEKATAHYTILLARLAKEPYKEAVTVLGLNRFVTYLTESQEAFETRYKEASDDKKKQANSPVLGLVRKEFSREYKTLIAYCILMAQLNPTEVYPTVLAAINQDRQYYATCLAQRKARKAKKAHPEGTSEEELQES